MSTVAIIATLTLIGSMIGSIALNIFSNFLTNWLEDWQSKRSLINARKDIDKLKHDYDRIEKYHKDKPFFYLFLFQCVFYFLIGVTIQISLYGLTLFIW